MGLGQLAHQKWGIFVGFVAVVAIFAVFAAFYLPLVRNNDDDDDDFVKPVDSYVSKMRASKVFDHLNDLQSIANKNNGNRAVGTSGYKASVDYIINTLKDGGAKCDPKKQTFQVELWAATADPRFAQLDPFVDYEEDFQLLQYSGPGNVTASVVSLPADNPGCTENSWDGFDVDGKIAVIIRGECGFADKASSAFRNGAIGVLIYNDGSNSEHMDSFTGTLAEIQPGPVFGISHSLGNQLATSTANFWMYAATEQNVVDTWNVLCEWKEGNEENTIVVGSHLDSVPAGPGISDNGSGSSMNLELAINLAKTDIKIYNKVIFAWWGAEEIGLKGSQYFVQNAFDNGDISDIQLNLNFDMIGSPNARLEVYDGRSMEDLDIKEGCVAIQSIFEQYFAYADLPSLTPVDKLNDVRSDYAPFVLQKIPAGGLCTGTSGTIKTMEERILYGGYANAPLDPCYHQDCDNIDNVSRFAVQSNSEGAAYAVGTLASSPQLTTLLGDNSQRREISEPKKTVFSSY